jgi:hypothetical protein
MLAGGRDYFAVSEQISLRALPQTEVVGIVERDSTAGDNFNSVRFTISGYFVDSP